ncbi:MAG: hypothetical protein ACRECO_06550 [Xanthobacteraceae bacterium]
MTTCPECGESVALSAGACANCGAPNPARRTLIKIGLWGSALAALVVLAAAALIVMRPATLPDGTDAKPDDDLAWLTEAMKKCDEDATKDPSTLHLMVIPLVDQAKDEPGWRRISLNDIGNAILIKAEDMLAGLKRDALRISKTEYIVAVRNETTKEIYKWSPSVGVKRFSTPNADAIEQFKIQFQPRNGMGGLDWGAVFSRQKGNCYWVNAIILR